MSGFQSPITVKKAMEKIHRREYLLPSFQREFVWDALRVENLFDSLMRGYPINSMLFWEVDQTAYNSFNFYDFLSSYIECHQTHNVRHNGFHGNFYAVLDGQQRLTSLYIGLYGSYAYHTKYLRWDNTAENFPKRHLYLNISKVDDTAGEGDKMYNFLFLKDLDTKNQTVFVDNALEKWFKVGEIVNLEKSKDFMDFIQSLNLNSEAVVLDHLRQVICVNPSINYYLEDSVSPNQAVNIFVRTNAGGKPLSISDILLSITIAGWTSIDARTEFQELANQVSNRGFSIDHDYILKAYLCLFHTSVKNKISSFDTTFLATMEKNWNSVKEYIICLFELLKSFGLDNSTLKSYNATLPILCYLYWNKKNSVVFTTSISHSKDREIIRKWLLKAIMFRSFGSSADNTIQKAISNLKCKNEFPATIISTSIGQPNVVDPTWVESIMDTQKDDPYAFAILSLLYPDCNFAVTKFDKDHMHPAALFQSEYKKLGGVLEWKHYNSIVNLQLLESSENKSKGDTPLSKWILSTLAKAPTLYNDTYIPKGISLETKDFDVFYQERKKLLIKEMLDILK